MITGIHQIEITSRCNLRCKYCVHPRMPRVKQDMREAVFVKALEWVCDFARIGTQGELNLCGIGESTLHPEFARFARLAREAIGEAGVLVMATNGVNVTEEHAVAMREARMRVWVSLHRPERAKLAIDLLHSYGVLAGVSADPSIAATDWAGQVDWTVTAQRPTTQCPWLRGQYAMVLSDGRVTTCSFDGQGADGVLGSVWDDVAAMALKPYSLCRTCHQYQPEAG